MHTLENRQHIRGDKPYAIISYQAIDGMQQKDKTLMKE